MHTESFCANRFFPQMSINVSGAVAIYKDEEYHKQDIGHCHCNKTKID